MTRIAKLRSTIVIFLLLFDGPSWAITDEDEGYPKLLFDTIDKRLLKSEALNSTFARS